MTGSHIDTVRTGGRYDGNLGVLAGLEVIETLQRAGHTPSRPLAVGFFTDEEGSRFAPDMLGSLVYVGGLPLEEAHDVVAIDGARLGDELERIGYLGPEPCVPRPFRAYLELHIEQGPILEEEGLPVGIVEGIVAISWSRVTLHGIQDHAGPTPMRIRHDALVAAAEIVRGVREIAGRIGGAFVSTVGRLDVTPNIPNAIPGRVALSVDFRDPDDANVDRALVMLGELVRDAAAREGVRAELDSYWRVARTPFDPEVVATVEAAARSLGCGHRRMLSGAGHDAQYMAAICPTGMVFVPSRAGRSHCEEEFTGLDDIEHGANVLLRAATTLAGEVGRDVGPRR
jgi:N-carbamoyl-L-amino-acid hydrolase